MQDFHSPPLHLTASMQASRPSEPLPPETAGPGVLEAPPVYFGVI